MKDCVIRYWIIAFAIILKINTVCVAQGNTTPCVGSTQLYTTLERGCELSKLEMITGVLNVDYEVSEYLQTKKIKWLNVGSFIMRMTYYNCSTPRPPVDIVISVKPNVSPLPISASQQIELYEGDNLLLTVAGYTNPVNWYDQNNALLGTTGQLYLGRNSKPGIYSYTAKVVNEYNCPVDGPTSATFQVTVKEYSETYFNRVETKQLDEALKVVSNSKSYFDGTGSLIQTQTKSMSREEVFTSETVKDEYGRPVISTLAAPTGLPDFKYKNRFIMSASGNFVDYQAYGGGYGYLDTTTPGTLGWYYSSNNTKQSNTPVSNYPFAQQVYFDDGTDEIAVSSGLGESQSIASGHGVAGGTFGVYNELDDYIAKRATLFPNSPHVYNKTGCSLKIFKDENGLYSMVILDNSGNEIMSARSAASTDYILAVQNDITSSVQNSYRPTCYLPLIQSTSLTVTTPYRFALDDLLVKERDFNKIPQGTVSWGPGLFKIVMFNSDPINLKYTLYLKDISYKFYDDRGYLISAVSPNGVKQWLSGIAYSNIDKTTYTYNFRGRLVSTKSMDAGEAKFQYRRDGAIRFSQNAKQKIDLHFSYTNYDGLNRPIESGEYIGSQYDFNSLKDYLELPSLAIGNNTEKRDWVATHYDYPDPDFNTITKLSSQSYVQSFLRGTVAWSENVNIRTWYSYDELGRVIWMAQKPKALPRVMVVKYKYDFLGNVLSVANLAYDLNANLLHQFYHHYEYDADKRLSKAYTSEEEGGSRRLRASYEYYLHGPLKRIELGDKLQGVDFVYNIQGWLTHINHPDPAQDPGGDSNDVFGMVLDYYESDLDNLFTTSANTHDPLIRHSLPTLSEHMVASHQPLIRFNQLADTDSADPNMGLMKKYSAENPVYKTMLQSRTNTTH